MVDESTMKEGESCWADKNRVSHKAQPKNNSGIAKTTMDLSRMGDNALLKAMVIGEVLATPRCKSRYGVKK